MDTIEVTVTKQDYNKSSKDYTDIFNCPLCQALRRTGINVESVGCERFTLEGQEYYDEEESGFRENDFDNLRDKGIEKTITFIKL